MENMKGTRGGGGRMTLRKEVLPYLQPIDQRDALKAGARGEDNRK